MIDFVKVFHALRAHPRPLRLFGALCLKRLGLSHLFLIRHRDFVLRFYPTAMGMAMFADPDFHNEDHDVFHSLLRPGDIVVDVGANIGTLTLTASLCVGETGKVLAFEAHPRTFEILVENINLNRRMNIFPYNVALGDKDGVLRFSDLQTDDQNSVLTAGKGIDIPVRRLDKYYDGESQIALLKIDVEGYEKCVLNGGENALTKTSCIYFESCEVFFNKYGHTGGDLFRFLRERGFEVYRGADRTLRRIPLDYSSIQNENLLALRDLAQFQERTQYRLA